MPFQRALKLDRKILLTITLPIAALLLVGCLNQPEPQDEWFYELITQEFGLNKTEYTLEYANSYLRPDGFLKAKGRYLDNSEIEIYYRFNASSSAGQGGGSLACFSSTSNQAFQIVKNTLCNNIRIFTWSDKGHEGRYWPELNTSQTSKARQDCLDGAFEKTEGQKRTIAILKKTGANSDPIVEKAEFNCLEIKPP